MFTSSSSKRYKFWEVVAPDFEEFSSCGVLAIAGGQHGRSDTRLIDKQGQGSQMKVCMRSLNPTDTGQKGEGCSLERT